MVGFHAGNNVQLQNKITDAFVDGDVCYADVKSCLFVLFAGETLFGKLPSSRALPFFYFCAQLLQRLFLNLPDALARDAEMFANNFQ